MTTSSSQLQEAFEKLKKSNSQTVQKFYEVFVWRGVNLPGVSESHRNVVGLELVLAELLSAGYELVEIKQEDLVDVSSDFCDMFTIASKEVFKNFALTERVFSLNCWRNQCSVENALLSLFQQYIDNKTVVPY